VENYPGFRWNYGAELIENMRKQAQRFGAEFKAGAVTEVDLTKRRSNHRGEGNFRVAFGDRGCGRVRAAAGLREKRTDWAGLHVRNVRRLFSGASRCGCGRSDSGDGRGELLSRYASRVY